MCSGVQYTAFCPKSAELISSLNQMKTSNISNGELYLRVAHYVMKMFDVFDLVLLPLHRQLCPPQSAIPGLFGARHVWGADNCVRLGKPDVVQQVCHQSKSVSVRSERRLHYRGRCGSRRPGNRRNHLHPDMHHHSAQWVSAVHITRTTPCGSLTCRTHHHAFNVKDCD